MDDEKEIVSVPYPVFEGEMARQERHIKRLWIALILCLVILFGTNIAWLVYESQFETYYYEQDSDGINNINSGTQGDILNEPEGQISQKEER